MRRTAPIVAALAPVVVAALVAGVLLALGERRELLVATSIPLAVLLAGLGVSGAAAVVLVVVRRSAARQAAARQAGVAEGRDLERAAHRRFLARLDHELKNPVTAIRATLAAAAEPPGSAPAGPLAIVDDQARRLATLVADLRKLSELETRALEREPVDLEQLVADAVTALEQQRPDLVGRVAVTVSRVPWPIPVLSADPDLLGLAIDNVLGNAAKFAVTGPIEVRLREDAGAAIVEVADTGRGVPLDAQEHVFDELARADNARDVSGSGIGLALVRTVLRRHGGDAELRSREGAGTVVTLRIPTGGAGDGARS